MALTYELANIPDFEQVCYTEDGTLAPVTHALVMLMMHLGLRGSITAKNAEEAVIQVAATQRVFGAQLWTQDDDGKWTIPRYITPDEVRAHVGLTTNSNVTRRQWQAMLVRVMRDESVRWVADQ
jgi:hypothetical protein